MFLSTRWELVLLCVVRLSISWNVIQIAEYYEMWRKRVSISRNGCKHWTFREMYNCETWMRHRYLYIYFNLMYLWRVKWIELCEVALESKGKGLALERYRGMYPTRRLLFRLKSTLRLPRVLKLFFTHETMVQI